MKKLFTLLLLLLIVVQGFSQSPGSFNYQAVLRNATGQVKVNEQVYLTISIVKDSINGDIVYEEEWDVETNKFGLVNLQIGTLKPTDFDTIDWSQGNYFLALSADNEPMGISQLLSVPFALHAKSAETVKNFSLSGIESAFENWDKNVNDDFDGKYSSLEGTPTNVSIFTNDAGYLTSDSISSFNDMVAFSISANDTARWSNKQNALTGDELLFENWDKNASDDFDGYYSSLRGAPNSLGDLQNDMGFITKEIDGSVTNELQVLSISNDTIYLSDGGFAKLPAETDPVYSAWDKDYADLINTPAAWDSTYTSIKNTPDLTVFQLSADDGDTNATNEIQILSISNDTIYLSDGGFAELPAETDPVYSAWDKDYADLINTPAAWDSTYTSIKNTPDLTVFQLSADDGDIDATNEIQILSISNDTIYLSDGGFAELPAETDPVYSAWDKDYADLINTPAAWDSAYSSIKNTPDLSGYTTQIALDDSIASVRSEDNDTDATNEIQILSISNDTIYLSDGGFAELPAETDPVYSAWDKDYADLINTPAAWDSTYASIKNTPDLSGYTTQIALDDSIASVRSEDNDTDATNEIQILSISNDTIYLSDGGFAELPAETDPVYSAWDKDYADLINTPVFDDLSPMSAAGDIIYGGTDGTGTILTKGTAGQVLTMNSGATAPEWQVPSTVDSIIDADGDTKIQLEESVDEDIIRFDVDGAEAVIINSIGDVGIGTSNPDEKLHISGTDSDVDLSTYGSDVSTIHFERAGGTADTPSTLSSSSRIGFIEFKTWDGNQFGDAAAIYSYTDGTQTAGETPGSLWFATTPSGSDDYVDAMEIDNDGDVIVKNDLYVDDDLKVDHYIRTGSDVEEGELRIYSKAAGESITIMANASTVADTLILPANDGDANQVLVTDGNGNLSWAAPSSGSNSIVSKSANYTATSSDKYIICTAGITVTLPTAVGISGTEYIIKNMSASAVTIATTSSQEIWQDATHQTTTVTLGSGSGNNWIKVVSDGANWIGFSVLY